MKFILVIYILLGTCMSAMITDAPRVRFGLKEVLIRIGKMTDRDPNCVAEADHVEI